MPNSFGFGAGGTSTNGATYTGAAYVYSVAGYLPTGNTNLAGTNVSNYKSITINGSYSNCTPSYDGLNAILTRSGSGFMYFSRWVDNGLDTEEAGGSPWTNGGLQGTVYWSTVPTAPASISLAKTGRQIIATITGSSSNGGETISSYSVQYRTSSNGGSTWGSWGGTQTISGSSTTYNNLTPALTYQFRTYANNSEGSSAARVSSNIFVSAGGKRYDGSTWNSTTTAKRFDGSTWVDFTTAKRYDGSTWVDLS